MPYLRNPCESIPRPFVRGTTLAKRFSGPKLSVSFHMRLTSKELDVSEYAARTCQAFAFVSFVAS